MAFRRVVVQPTITLTGAYTQEVRYAVQTTGGKTAFFWVNVFVKPGAASTITLYGAASVTLNDDVSSNSFWVSIASVSISNAEGAYKSGEVTPLPAFLRWGITGNTGGSLEIIEYVWEV